MTATASQLRRMSRELFEASEAIDRIATAVDKTPTKITAKTPLVSMVEIAEMTGIAHTSLRAMRVRKQLPLPVADLAIGPVWLRSDITKWHRKRNGAS